MVRQQRALWEGERAFLLARVARADSPQHGAWPSVLAGICWRPACSWHPANPAGGHLVMAEAM